MSSHFKMVNKINKGEKQITPKKRHNSGSQMQSLQRLVPQESKDFYEICQSISSITLVHTINEQQLRKIGKIVKKLKIINKSNKELLDSEIILLDDIDSLIKNIEKTYQFVPSQNNIKLFRTHLIESVIERLNYIQEIILSEEFEDAGQVVKHILFAINSFKKIIEINEFNHKKFNINKLDKLLQIYYQYSHFIFLISADTFEADENKMHEFIQSDLRTILNKEDLNFFIESNF